ncbi:MAG: aminopeptidase P N-terminal domain-containing protein [Bacteroidetes bacterium]|nr:aminopeptidase P N-terminal domain-containing protein [Bacteroidota bacterium]
MTSHTCESIFHKLQIPLFLSFFLLLVSPAISQNQLPQDYLSADFHKDRREALRNLLPPNSMAVFFANPIRNRANDVDYVYHQNPDFYYLTGFREPEAVLVIFSSPTDIGGSTCNEIIYIREKNATAEMWTGRRSGLEKAEKTLGISCVKLNKAFAELNLDPEQFDKILFLPFRNDERDGGSKTDLASLKAQFKEMIQYPENFNTRRYQLYELMKTTDLENSANVAQVIDRYFNFGPQPSSDDPLELYRNAKSDLERKTIIEELPPTNIDASALGYMMGQLREIKTPEEMALLRKAINISAVAQTEVMKAMHPDMSELEVQGIHEFVYKKYGAEYEGYPSIVGAGENGCILHYIDNLEQKLDNDLVLMDVGAEYHGYTADVTRTIPANGKFSPEQKKIYQIVLEAQEAAFEKCKPGSGFSEPHIAAQQVINKGLAELGIIKKGEYHSYFPHGTSHYLGLDVHDRGNYGPLAQNMVITVEPGIYIPHGSPCDEKWWGIAVRIEDDVLITADGYENLSRFAPRKAEEIESLMAKPSPLDDFILPNLEEIDRSDE